ncbi:MAG: hypothetical protein A2X94_17495 [Bdellovibrionales bacterium GWB1_55_8]|nr:MAG: hypothetical protein A2X94_17495 [Bdellovibrionales bacterium GWB1_55_8]
MQKVSAFLTILLLTAGCASSRVLDSESTRLFREGRYEDAATRLEEGLKREGDGKDQLLYLLDLGLSLHSAGKYEESNRAFLAADKVAEIKDYTSLAAESATLLTTDTVKDYKGEDFENVLISTYLAMNYALLGDNENALVEARRVNRKLHLMIFEGKRKYKQNAFARYLSAILYEAEGDPNDAYIDYKKTRELRPGFPGLGRDLWRTARLTGMRDEMEAWDNEYGLTEEDHRLALEAAPRSGKGEIIILYENGISPVKRPNPDFRQLPKFYPRPNPVSRATIQLDGRELAQTAVLHDIERTAIQNLEEKYGGLVAKKIAGLVAKELVSDQIERHTKSPALGFMARVILYASDRADVRSWNLLPRDLQIARIPVEPGVHEVRILPDGSATLPAKTVHVEAGRKVFVNFRYMP